MAPLEDPLVRREHRESNKFLEQIAKTECPIHGRDRVSLDHYKQSRGNRALLEDSRANAKIQIERNRYKG